MNQVKDRLPAPACFREVEEKDLPSIARWFRQSADLPPEQQQVILESFIHLYAGPDGLWRRHTRVMTLGEEAVLAVELIAGEVNMVAKPCIARDAALLRGAWRQVLEYFFFEEGLPVIGISIPAYRLMDIRALQALGCRRRRNFTDNQVTHHRYVCRPKNLRR